MQKRKSSMANIHTSRNSLTAMKLFGHMIEVKSRPPKASNEKYQPLRK
jgi:hypothetical protein